MRFQRVLCVFDAFYAFSMHFMRFRFIFMRFSMNSVADSCTGPGPGPGLGPDRARALHWFVCIVLVALVCLQWFGCIGWFATVCLHWFAWFCNGMHNKVSDPIFSRL